MQSVKRWVGLAILAALVLAGLTMKTAPAFAQDGGEFPLPPGVTWDDVNRVARQMYCSVCAGIPLDTCESVACRQWREEIARQLSEGRTDDQIINDFVARFGGDVAAVPRDKSDRFLVFAVPISIALILGVVGLFQVRHMRKRGQQGTQAARRGTGRLTARPIPEELDPRILERLERELEGLES
jgi:cytochrome c-type biogenesis protein CcmH